MRPLNPDHVRGIFHKFGGGELGAARVRLWSVLKKLARFATAASRRKRGQAKLRRRARRVPCQRCDAAAGDLCANRDGATDYVHPIRVMDYARTKARERGDA